MNSVKLLPTLRKTSRWLYQGSATPRLMFAAGSLRRQRRRIWQPLRRSELWRLMRADGDKDWSEAWGQTDQISDVLKGAEALD